MSAVPTIDAQDAVAGLTGAYQGTLPLRSE
jgi:hypothetical protein